MADDTTPAKGALQDVLDLAELMQQGWDRQLATLRRSGVPLLADDGDGGGDGGGDAPGARTDEDGDDDKLGDPGKKAIAAERAARRDAEKALKDAQARLKDLEDRDKSESEKLTERVSDAETRATAAETRLARVNAAIKKKLPLDLADRLIGDTSEELERDAERLAKQLTPANGGGFDQGARGGGQPQNTDDLIRRAAGRA